MRELLVKSEASFSDASLQWLIDAARKVNGQLFNATDELIASFSSIYHAIRLYHGTRVEDPEIFRQTGILLSNLDELNRRALELFGKTPQVCQAIKELRDSEYVKHNTGKIFVCLDPKACLKYDYCWLGSEYLRTVANRVGTSEILAAIGTPTLLSFNISLEDLAAETVGSIAGLAIGSIYKNWRKPGSNKYPIDFGFGLTNPVSPTQIREVRRLQR